ncbi:DUF2975 domain-containing protein [Arthrobacter psychrochitiniphilus]|uniref:DUF2975 domain-containing protein n=1 Tax=Arthrobacter psychrochitiniphilus TaxID=291045 RepID=A0A2V3DPH0_9MICC|nr:DUF2975 domain-containing protein [Arthrobacter psychrochitiniphilus]NYG16926.1 hypothetical protein [Arthrobacter psychrochitiniphilus]PXA64835.1 hypothetical protein CVS29_13585 [Arthrobacter psychrochitiniphilus]
MNFQQIRLLRIAVVMLALGSILTQVFITPHVARSFAEAYPEVAYLERPYTIAVIVAIAGFELALLAIWQILSIVKRGAAFTRSPMRWVNFMTTSFLFTAATLIGIIMHATFIAKIGTPAMLFGLLVTIAFGASAIFFRAAVKRGLLTRIFHDDPEHDIPAP